MTSLLRLNFVFVGLLTLIGVITSSWQAKLMAPGFDQQLMQTLSSQIKITWLFFLGVGASLGLRALLNEREVFWPGASVSLVSGGVLSLGCLAYAMAGTTDWSAAHLTRLTVVASVIVFAVHGIVGRHDLPKLLAGHGGYPMRVLALSVLSVFVYQALNTLPRFIDRAVASDFPQGAIAALEYSFNVLTVAGILLATSFTTIFYPAFAKAVDKGESKRPYVLKFGLIALLAAAIGLGFFLWAQPLVELVYGRGAFDGSAVTRTTEFFRWHGLGLPFMVCSIILANGLLGYRRIGTLVAVGVFRVLVKIVSVWILVPTYEATGLAISFIIVEISTMSVLLILVGNLMKPAKNQVQ